MNVRLLLFGILGLSVLGSVSAMSADMPNEEFVATEVVSPMGRALVEGTSSFFGKSVAADTKAILDGMTAQSGLFAPACEPAVVDLLGLLGGGGGLRFVTSTHYGGRGTVYSSPAGSLFSLSGHEMLDSFTTSPLVLDLSGCGRCDVFSSTVDPHPYSFEPTSSRFFDIDGDGYADYTEWVGPTAGILVITNPSNPLTSEDGSLIWQGPISGRDLVGTVGGYRNGFERLSAFDVNSDGKIAGDELNRLIVWTDIDGNAQPDPGELLRPGKLGIESLSTKYSGTEGSYVRDGETFRMWDWWPTMLNLRPEFKATSTTDSSVRMDGVMDDLGGPELTASLPVQWDGNHLIIPTRDLEKLGLNPVESILAELSPKGETVMLVDYRTRAPHLARLWILRRELEQWCVYRFALREDIVDQVHFNESGSRLLVLAANQNHQYLVTGWQSGAPRLSRVRWTTPNLQFRVYWGTDCRAGASWCLPGYFHTSDGQPVIDALADFSPIGRRATLTPTADIHWLAGHLLPEQGIEKPFMNWIASPELSYAVCTSQKGGVELYALSGRDAAEGTIRSLDRADSIAGLSAYHQCLEYLAESDGGAWALRWVKLGDDSPTVCRRLSIPLSYRPSYPELADSGRRPVWLQIDWKSGSTIMWTLDALQPQAVPYSPLKLDSIPGPMRVASRAPIYAVQTRTGIIVGRLSGGAGQPTKAH